jgi:PAS domain S-box-containing protein
MTEAGSMRVLVVDDDPDTRSNLCDILALDDHQVETAGSAAEVLGRGDWSGLSAVLLDRRLPDGTAEELLPRIRERAPETAVLIVTGYHDLQGAVAALRQGAADYILKPINADALRASLARIAEGRRLRQAQARSEAAFRTLVEAAPCLIVILRPDRTITYFSPFAEELTGYPAREVIGNDYRQTLLPEAHRRAVDDEIERALAGVPSRGFQSPVVSHGGLQHWMVWNLQRLDDYEGDKAVLAVGQDITTLKEAQERALQAERLAAIGQMVTGLAHESGNALARSRGCLEMLAWEVEDRPEALQLIQRTQQAQDHLQQLYEEVRGYAAPIKLEREDWDLSGAWRQAWTNLAHLREGRDAVLREHVTGVDLHCPVDQFRLEQVFRNIFENSLAACRDPVRIDVTCTAMRLAGRPAVRISLRDNGPGLSLEQRQRIFEPFFTTKTKGTGLGMAIAKRIIEAHGGQIAVGPELFPLIPPAPPGGEAPKVLPSPAGGEGVGATGGRGAEILITLPRESP